MSFDTSAVPLAKGIIVHRAAKQGTWEMVNLRAESLNARDPWPRLASMHSQFYTARGSASDSYRRARPQSRNPTPGELGSCWRSHRHTSGRHPSAARPRASPSALLLPHHWPAYPPARIPATANLGYWRA